MTDDLKNVEEARAKLAAEINATLPQFLGGGDKMYRHMTGARFTEGVHYLAKKAGAFWLVDEILGRQAFAAVRQEEFQVWILAVDLVAGSAVLRCQDGNNNIVHTTGIQYTDFPMEEARLWFTNGMLQLPVEY